MGQEASSKILRTKSHPLDIWTMKEGTWWSQGARMKTSTLFLKKSQETSQPQPPFPKRRRVSPLRPLSSKREQEGVALRRLTPKGQGLTKAFISMKSQREEGVQEKTKDMSSRRKRRAQAHQSH